MKTRTPAYQFTFDFRSVDDAMRLELLRSTVRKLNKTRPAGAPRLRVSLKGRLGKGNPAYATKYKGRFYAGIDMQDATRADVYIHTRTDR